jgi:hypothetical protein
MAGGISAQITIGSGIEPVKGAILDLKDQNATINGGVTSTTGGLLLPRVNLENLNQLYPFFNQSIGGQSDYENNIKPSHKALTVYHIGGNNIEEGIYVWDGKTWKRLLAPNSVEGGTVLTETLLFYRTLNDTKKGNTISDPRLHTGYSFVIPAGTLVPDGSFIDYMFRWFRTGTGVDAWYGLVRFSTPSATYTYSCSGFDKTEYVETGRIVYNRGYNEDNSDATLSLIGMDGSETKLTNINNTQDITVQFLSYTIGLITTVTIDYARFTVTRIDE